MLHLFFKIHPTCDTISPDATAKEELDSVKIFNVMLSRDLGGIQQAYLDYAQALEGAGATVINIASKGAAMNVVRQPDVMLPNWTSWCWVSRLHLYRLIRHHRPDCVIAHGGRAVKAVHAVKPGWTPLIGVTHVSNPTYLLKANYLLAITQALKTHMIDQGFLEDHIFVVPNMTRLKAAFHPPVPPNNRPWVVGSYGRFATQKGYAHLIDAMSILRQQGVQVNLVLGGGGELENELKRQVRDLNLQDHVTFPGWVKDREAFFNAIDVFCLSSIHEPFGLVLLEAMTYSKPILSTGVSGPAEILQDGKDAVLCEPGSGQALAQGIQRLMDHPEKLSQLAQAAHEKVVERYSMETVSKQLMATLNQVMEHWHARL